MPFKVDCTLAKEKGISAVFKLKKSLGDVRIAQKALESHPMSLGDVDQALSVENALNHEQEIVQAEAHDSLDDYATDLSDTASVASDSSTDSKVEKAKNIQSTYFVSHPWDIVDYHLYICTVEKGMNTHTRRNGMFVYDGLDCRPIFYRELFEDETFDPSNIGEQPQFLSWILPIIDQGRSPSGRHYVLGFDYNNKALFARHFEWIPSKTDDIWCVWDHGFNMYNLTIPDLLTLLKSCVQGNANVGAGLLSSGPHCKARGVNDDPGLELVIVILFCQWVLDFGEVLFEHDEDVMDKFMGQLSFYMEECRVILQRASYRAWFASRDGYSKAAYSRKSAVDKYINDLYTFSKSSEDRSLNGQPWRAPGLDTCNILRDQDRVQRKEQAEKRLENLFAINEADTFAKSSEQILGKMLAKLDENLEDTSKPKAASNLEPPRTPSPRPLRCVSPMKEWSPGSPGIITPTTDLYDDFEATEYHKIPLTLILERALDLVATRPELDTLVHRGQFGALLSEIGICVQRQPMDEFSLAPKLGYENDSWKLEMHSLAGSNAPLVRRLLSSPILD